MTQRERRPKPSGGDRQATTARRRIKFRGEALEAHLLCVGVHFSKGRRHQNNDTYFLMEWKNRCM